MTSLSLLRWTFVVQWTGLKGMFRRYRWGWAGSEAWPTWFLGPIKVMRGPRGESL